MDISKILEELRKELEQVEEAILSMERLAIGTGRRRGRPPAWLSKIKEEKRDDEDREEHAPDHRPKDSSAPKEKAAKPKEPPRSESAG